MKLAAMVCNLCGAILDTGDPLWTRAGDDDLHNCEGNGIVGGFAVLRGRGRRDARIADDQAFTQEIQRRVDQERTAHRRARTMKELTR
jgi:hypothetical protein